MRPVLSRDSTQARATIKYGSSLRVIDWSMITAALSSCSVSKYDGKLYASKETKTNSTISQN